MSWTNLNFQNPNSITMIKTTIFHNLMMIVLINITTILVMMMKFNLKNKMTYKSLFSNQKMEVMWTLYPIMCILLIMTASINLLYMNFEMKNNSIIIKTMSNQWFWNYEYPNLSKNFNSYLLMNSNFNMLMLETDNSLTIPFNYQILNIYSSMDVIHSWTIPSINMKMDCIPNQINSLSFIINKPTIMFGQCSEICGINHSFMPIKMESISINNFMKWI